jgi:hypothetical protein
MLATSHPRLDLVPGSRVAHVGGEFALARAADGLTLVASVPSASAHVFDAFDGETSAAGASTLLVAPLSPSNAAALRAQFPWLTPRPVGLVTSAGLGDRLGLATPGHLRALKAVGGGIAPVLAQQSIREMSRTGRTPQEVLDAATWGAFAEDWRGGFGADADHLKTTADIDACLAAGFTWFTIDPSEHVFAGADDASPAALAEAVRALPWARLEDDEPSLRSRYVDRAFDVGGHVVRLSEAALLRSAAKYGGAVAHVAAMYRHLRERLSDAAFDLEVSVDETDSPTSHAEHLYVAHELRRLGVRWDSLAPRYIGRFEKGVDYIGDIAAFDADLAVHAAIARSCGPYKLSLHSGSDKFSIYESAAARTDGLVHMKTAGTSYLEALRTASKVAPALFREVYAFSLGRYESDRASYHVSARLDRVPDAAGLSDTDLPAILEDFDARQVLHVTFGSVLTARDDGDRPQFRERLLAVLRAHDEAYAACLERHFVRHLAPFADAPGSRRP